MIGSTELLKIEGFYGIGTKNTTEGSSPAVPVTAASPTATGVVPERGKPAKAPKPTTFKIHGSIADMEERALQKEEKHPSSLNTEARSPFDQEAVIKAISSFSPPEGDIALKSALGAYPPLVEEENITLSVDHELVLNQAQEMLPLLRDHLKQQLHNEAISLQLTLHVVNNIQEKQAPLYTAQDKYNHFVSLNPNIEKLRKQFGLELE